MLYFACGLGIGVILGALIGGLACRRSITVSASQAGVMISAPNAAEFAAAMKKLEDVNATALQTKLMAQMPSERRAFQ